MHPVETVAVCSAASLYKPLKAAISSWLPHHPFLPAAGTPISYRVVQSWDLGTQLVGTIPLRHGEFTGLKLSPCHSTVGNKGGTAVLNRLCVSSISSSPFSFLSQHLPVFLPV